MSSAWTSAVQRLAGALSSVWGVAGILFTAISAAKGVVLLWKGIQVGGDVEFLLVGASWIWGLLDRPIILAPTFLGGVLLLVWALIRAEPQKPQVNSTPAIEPERQDTETKTVERKVEASGALGDIKWGPVEEGDCLGLRIKNAGTQPIPGLTVWSFGYELWSETGKGFIKRSTAINDHIIRREAPLDGSNEWSETLYIAHRPYTEAIRLLHAPGQPGKPCIVGTDLKPSGIYRIGVRFQTTFEAAAHQRKTSKQEVWLYVRWNEGASPKYVIDPMIKALL